MFLSTLLLHPLLFLLVEFLQFLPFYSTGKLFDVLFTCRDLGGSGGERVNQSQKASKYRASKLHLEAGPGPFEDNFWEMGNE